MEEIKGLKVKDIENDGYYITLTLEDGYIVKFSPTNYGEAVKGTISKIEYKQVGKI